MLLQWIFKPFSELSVSELYDLLRLRSEVFVVEQHCVFLDMDNKDQACYHLLGYRDNLLAASTRIVPAGVAYPDYVSIGRVVSAPQVRGTGAGKELMEVSLQKIRELFGHVPVKIGAQLYLKKFYESFGFEICGPVYDEDGIDHVPMIRPAS